MTLNYCHSTLTPIIYYDCILRSPIVPKNLNPKLPFHFHSPPIGLNTRKEEKQVYKNNSKDLH